MAKRGRKAVDLRHLDRLDRECFKGFHRLCRGTVVPNLSVDEARRMLVSEQIEEQAHREDLEALKRMSVEDFWADFTRNQGAWRSDLRLGAIRKAELLTGYEASVRSSQERQADLASVIKELGAPKNAKTRLESFRVWRALWQADDTDGVLKACRQWDKLPARYRDAMVSSIVAEHADAFVMMKNDPRFPRSRWGDGARIGYLAKGTAGLLMGISPLTAIERLRKFTHKRGHSLFHKTELPEPLKFMAAHGQRAGQAMCMCWRCILGRRRERGAVPY